MPVIDLKDYLGMPQQAPAQPVFQATTQNVDPMALRAADPYSSDAFLANVEARQRLAGLQRLAPVFQAQQAQLAYDQVAEQARQLRQKQEIEAQVQRATEEITQGAIDPESDQFNQQVMGLYTRNPMAFADNRMQQAMSFLGRRADELAQQKRLRAEAEYDVQQGLVEARQKEREELDKLRIDAIDSGAPQDLVLSAKSPYEVAALKAQYGGRTERDIRGQMMEKDLGLLAGEMKRLEDLGEDAVTDETGKTTYTPRYQSLMDESAKLQGELRGFYQSKYRTPAAPTVTPPPAGGAAAPAPAPTGNERIQIQPPIETKQSLMSVAPTNRNESFYKRLLGRADLTPEERTATETEFKSFIQQAPPTEGAASSILDVRTRPERTKAREEAVLKVSKEAEDQRKWVEAWETSKNQVRSAIQKIADETGYSPQEVMESLRRGERVSFKVGDRNLSLEQWLGKLLGAERYTNTPLVGVPKDFTSWRKEGLLAALSDRSPPIWAKVLDLVLQEPMANQNTVAPASPNASVLGVPKIQIGTPIQTTR